MEFGDYIIIRYREVTKGDYINSAAIGLIDKREGRIYSLWESSLMLDDKITGMWKFFSEMEELEKWQAEVLKGYRDVKIEDDQMVVEGNGTFIVGKNIKS